MLLARGVLSMSVHSLANEVETGPRSHILVFKDARIFSASSSDTGV